jgi:threonine dehydratase
MKIAIEPSSATAVAAVIFHRDRVPGRRIGVILTGGNVDFPKGG